MSMQNSDANFCTNCSKPYEKNTIFIISYVPITWNLTAISEVN